MMAEADPMTLLQQAVCLHREGRLPEAEGLYLKVLQVLPDHPEALHLLGLAALQMGQTDRAIEYFRRAIHATPGNGQYYFSLGNALLSKGNSDVVEACYRQAIQLKPDHAEAHCNLGNVLLQKGQTEEALACCRRALSIRPEYPEAYNNQGTVLKELEKWDESIASYRHALQLRPDYVDACSNLGGVLLALSRLDEAEAVFRQALAIRPDDGTLHYNLANLLKDQGRMADAVASYRQAVALKPDLAEAHFNEGHIHAALGNPGEAIACYRRALLVRPDYHEAYTSLIFTLDLSPDASMADLVAERLRWSEACAAGFQVPGNHGNTANPERRLRVGYVSADFREHSAAVGFGAMLVHHDRQGFEVFVYMNSPREDAVTEMFRRSVDHWCSVVGWSDEALAGKIREDGIDILVDLSAHSLGNRLLTFARKPAPIQVTAWGYAGGTGMKAMDAIFTDPVIVPAEEKLHYVEDVRYLPCVVSAFFSKDFPPVTGLPAMNHQDCGVTFGSFNRIGKISDSAFRAWKKILQALPGCRLMLKSGELSSASGRERVLGNLIRMGFDPGSLILKGGTPWEEHVATFNEIDISLDPFPQSGGVTTLESLMMGVPVVTLRGQTFAGRGSASILTNLGLSDWIAASEDDYVNLAVKKAQDMAVLQALRGSLRPRFRKSMVGDTIAYVKAAEAIYRQLWGEWCVRSTAVPK